jgi:hypothetical protein
MDEKRRMREDGRGIMYEKKTNKIKTVRDLKVYRKAFDSAIKISFHCKYIDEETFQRLEDSYGPIFVAMLNQWRRRPIRSVVPLLSEAILLPPSNFHKPPPS